MKPIFGQGPSLQLRLFLAILISLGLIFADSKLNAFSRFRYILNSAISPLLYTANMPLELLDN